jgi:protein-S-isoprenylcysteine O-methyltransferase Ste14
MIAIIFLTPGAYLGIVGVKATGVKVSETHRPESVVVDGIYNKIRHPQYMGAVLSHIGMSFLISGLYSLIATPVIITASYLTSRKEEQELINEFGDEYETYQSRVPMFIPIVRFKKRG